MQEFWLDALRSMRKLRQLVASDAGPSAASLLLPGLDGFIADLASEDLTAESIRDIEQSVLLISRMLAPVDLMTTGRIRRQVSLTSEALFSWIYAMRIEGAERGLKRGDIRQVRVALFWANGSASETQVRRLAESLGKPFGQYAPDLEKLRRHALRRARGRSSGREAVSELFRATGVEFESSGPRRRYLLASRNGGRIHKEQLEQARGVLETLASDGLLAAQDARLSHKKEYFPCVQIPEGLEGRLSLALPEVLIERDTLLSPVGEVRTLQGWAWELEKNRGIAGVSVELNDPEAQLQAKSTDSSVDGKFAFLLQEDYVERVELRVAPKHTFWSRRLSLSALSEASGKVALGRHGKRCWWRARDQPFSPTGTSPVVRVGLVDTGLAPHSDLQAMGGWSVTELSGLPWDEDPRGHGTHCSGIICGRNPRGVEGRFPDAELWVYRVSDGSSDSVFLSNVAEAVVRAAEESMDIVNVSLGGQVVTSTVLSEALSEARRAGCLLVAAAGNSGGEGAFFPARHEKVIGVGAYGRFGTYPEDSLHRVWESKVRSGRIFVPTFSNYGEGIDLLAPGVAILSTFPGGRYGVWDGTSMATAYTSGTAARLLAEDEGLQKLGRGTERVEQLRRKLLDECSFLKGIDEAHQGKGVLQV